MSPQQAAAYVAYLMQRLPPNEARCMTADKREVLWSIAERGFASLWEQEKGRYDDAQVRHKAGGGCSEHETTCALGRPSWTACDRAFRSLTPFGKPGS